MSRAASRVRQLQSFHDHIARMATATSLACLTQLGPSSPSSHHICSAFGRSVRPVFVSLGPAKRRGDPQDSPRRLRGGGDERHRKRSTHPRSTSRVARPRISAVVSYHVAPDAGSRARRVDRTRPSSAAIPCGQVRAGATRQPFACALSNIIVLRLHLTHHTADISHSSIRSGDRRLPSRR